MAINAEKHAWLTAIILLFALESVPGDVFFTEDFEDVPAGTQLHTLDGWSWVGGGFIGRISPDAAHSGLQGVDSTRNAATETGTISGDLARYHFCASRGAFTVVTNGLVTGSLAVRAVDWTNTPSAYLRILVNDHEETSFGLSARNLLHFELRGDGTLIYWGGSGASLVVAATGVPVDAWNKIGFTVDLDNRATTLSLNDEPLAIWIPFRNPDATPIFTGVRFQEWNAGLTEGGVYMDDIVLSHSSSPDPAPRKMPVLLSAHRGNKVVAPENTILAFEGALDVGADMIELDLQMTSDRQIVLMHDRTVDRTTDGTGFVSDMTLEDIKALDAGSWYDPAFTGTRVPTLEETLQWADGRIMLLLDMKPQGVVFADAAAPIIQAYGHEDGVVLGPNSVEQALLFRERIPSFRQLAFMDHAGLLDDFLDAGVDAVLLWFSWTQEDPTLVTRVREAGREVLIYGGGERIDQLVELMPFRPDYIQETDIRRLDHLLHQFAVVEYQAAAGGHLTGEQEQWLLIGRQGLAVEAVAEPGSVFHVWSDGRTDNPRTDTGTLHHRSLTAHFRSASTGADLSWYADHGFTPAPGESWEQVEAQWLPLKGTTLHDEYVADTDPNDLSDRLRFATISPNGAEPSTPRLTFNSSPRRIYTLRGTQMLSGEVWHAVPGAGPRPGQGEADWFLDQNDPGYGPFYKLHVSVQNNDAQMP